VLQKPFLFFASDYPPKPESIISLGLSVCDRILEVCHYDILQNARGNFDKGAGRSLHALQII